MNKYSLNRFFSNESTDSERKEVIRYLLDPTNDVAINDWMKAHWDLICSLAANEHSSTADESKMWQHIMQKIKENETVYLPVNRTPVRSFRQHFKKLVAAAAILIILVGGYAYYLSQAKIPGKSASDVPVLNLTKNTDVAPPTSSRAVLTLADGTTVWLDSAGNGQLATQGSVNVLKNASGEIVYTGLPSDQISYNTLSLPRGSKPMRLVLADGSMVWLNAASSVTYPTAFKGNERRVKITGEAYFEITRSEAMPFYVVHEDMQVKVLGTHFNVNTYQDESEVKVTLLEGSVNVSSKGKSNILKPGQQAKLFKENIKIMQQVDIDEVMAWKNDQFYFTGTDIKTIMRQIEKYYDVNVEYRDQVPYQFVAKISRQVNVSEFLEKLELTNLIHFKIEGNKVIVSK
ncbi:MAG: FecR domain-containing protein [Gloeobacteraceae cyanobacterium ES-bin-316]|nr:FecR domain-containing protein [Ferruginibacter sp.]